MAKTSKLMKKTMKCFTFENMAGLILAILILFEMPVEQNIKELLNSPPGMILSLVLLVILFIFLNPVVGILFLIYLYECVKNTGLNMAKFIPTNLARTSVMKQLNKNVERKESDKVELNTIQRMAPIVKKRENRNVSFVPNQQTTMKFESV